MEKKRVTKEEFDSFIAAYPNKLIDNVSHMYDPPLLSYNDFTAGKKWPDSVVAFAHLCEAGSLPDLPNEYFICG